MRLLPLFVLLLPLTSTAQEKLQPSYAYSFGYESSLPGHLVTVYHQLKFTSDTTCEYHRCKIAYQSGRFVKPALLDTLKVSGSYSFAQNSSELLLDFKGADSGLEFPLGGSYELREGQLICRVKENHWFHEHPMFETGHFERCGETGHLQSRNIHQLVHHQHISFWSCEVDKWAIDITVE